MYLILNKASFYDKLLLIPRTIPKLENHPLSDVCDCIFNVFAATLCIGGLSIRKLMTRHAVVTGTHMSWLRVFENRVLKRIFGPKWDKVTEEWRTVLLTKYYSGNQIEKDEMGGYVARMGERREEVYKGFWWGYVRERDNLVDPGVNGRIILRWISRKWNGLD